MFPASPTTTTVTYDSSAAQAFDSITFSDNYNVSDSTSGARAITLTPTTATSCGSATTIAICETAGSSTFAPAVVLGSDEEFAAAPSTSTVLTGVVSGAHMLTAGDTTNTGAITLSGTNSYTGGTTVGGGSLWIRNSSALGTGTVTVGSGNYLELQNLGDPITVDNTLHLGNGSTSRGWAWLLDETSSDHWGGTIELDPTTVGYIAAASSSAFFLDGNIVDASTTPPAVYLNGCSNGGTLWVNGTGNTFTGGANIDNGEVTLGSGSSLGTGTTTLGTCSPDAFLTGGGQTPPGATMGPLDSNAILAPESQDNSEILTSTGNDDLNTDGSGQFEPLLFGTTAGSQYSQFVSSGNIDLASARLDPIDFDSHSGDTFTVVKTTGEGTISGTFDSPSGTPLNDGDTFTTSLGPTKALQIHYTATTVTLTNVSGTQGGTGGPTPPQCPAGSTDCNTGTSSAPGGSTTASAGGVTATASGGTGGLTVASYGSTDPAGPPTFNSTGQYFDVSLSRPNTFTTVVIDDCAAGGGTTLEWWDPSANAGAGGWAPVVGDPGPTYDPGPPPCVSVTLDSTTSPSIAQLSGTVFAAAAGGPAGPPTSGYWATGSDGGIFAFGNAGFFGSLPGLHVTVNNIVGIAPSFDRGGYWLVGSDGGIFGFGDAAYHGSVPGVGAHVNNIVGIAPTPDGGGY